MLKLLNGILKFRDSIQPLYKKKYARLAEGQNPKVLMITCSDSRISSGIAAGAEIGDIFLFRNIGNIIPKYEDEFLSRSHVPSEYVAIEFAIQALNIQDIIICGHSGCGAIDASLQLKHTQKQTPCIFLDHYLIHIQDAHKQQKNILANESFSLADRLSQANVLHQVEHLQTIPMIQQAINNNQLKLHAWWYDIARVEMMAYQPSRQCFRIIDNEFVQEYLKDLANQEHSKKILCEGVIKKEL